MRFQTKLLFSYSLIIVFLVILLGIGFYRYSTRVFERNAYSNLLTVSDRMARQLDNLVRPMDFITTYLLSTSNFMSSMASMAYLDRTRERDLIYVNEGWRDIKATLLSYSVSHNFRAVNVFNRQGDFLSSNLVDFAFTRDPRPRLAELSWIARADARAGRAVILPPYVDPWGPPAESPTVFGLVRVVQGPKGPMGYIEVQNDLAELDRLFAMPQSDGLRVYAFFLDGMTFHVPAEEDAGWYARLARDQAGGGADRRAIHLVRNHRSGAEEIVATATAEYAGIRVVLVQERAALFRSLAFTRNITFLIGILIVLVSLLYGWLFSRQLALPIRRLKVQMEDTELDNLPDALALESANDEIEALNVAFLRLRSRLNEAVRRELISQSLEERARFDALQVQVSPHFLYNILTVIANKGLEAGSDEIGEICNGIAAMLRYSTSTTSRTATIREEVEHVRTYLFLMKQRLEHRLEFSIGVDEALLDERIPKIVLQQLAENCINHGFDGMRKTVRIVITGRTAGNRWQIEVADDGKGFDPDVLAGLRARIGGIAEKPSEVLRDGSAIGGMGLVNLYLRLALFYEDDFDFSLGNKAGGGALVTIGACRGSGGGVCADCTPG